MRFFLTLAIFFIVLMDVSTLTYAKNRLPHLSVSEPVDHRLPIPGTNYAISVMTCP
jgi:hypothetical protein